MKFSVSSLLSTVPFILSTMPIGAAPQTRDDAESCYYIPLPNGPSSDANRTVPWGHPTIRFANGTTCCSSLDQVRSALDGIDAQLLQLLSTRAAYVREAARFKGRIEDIDVSSRDQQVIQRAIDGAPGVHLPQIVAEKVYQGIINSSVMFEECVFNAYDPPCDPSRR